VNLSFMHDKKKTTSNVEVGKIADNSDDKANYTMLLETKQELNEPIHKINKQKV